MPNHDLFAAPFTDGHVTTHAASIIAPIVNVPEGPIVVVAIVITVSVTAVSSYAEVQLGKRDFGFGRDSISGRCRDNPHCAHDGGDEWQFSHSNLLLAVNIAE